VKYVKNTDMKNIQSFVDKVNESFFSLSENETVFSISDDLVKDTWKNDPEGELVIETVYKILDLFNSSTPEQLDYLFSGIEVEEVIKIANEK
jgi:hypothetical protein